MVGSGFSRNAEKTRFDADDIPDWEDVARNIYESLYPQGSDDSGHGPRVAQLSAENALRLGQEFVTEFGRSKLHELLEKLVRDGEFAPGETHFRLLRLPWRDVFTTNWDTLLERASSNKAAPAYSVVQNMEQLPLKSQPRIVKLHGSLPAQFPLIFTDEDYRTYPIQFAPYVNTVQQAMMESLFLLIGFSGDDPNFLNWSGWVRDNLGEAAPKIYLAGWLGLSRHRRRMLEDRGVIAIDIADHPRAREWPDRMRHQNATDWLLHSLEEGQPYDKTIWPSPQKREFTAVPEYLQPVDRIVEDVPISHPEKERRTNSPNYENEPLERVKHVLDAWAHNRRLYPGWLIFPFGQAHYDLSYRTKEWESPILESLPHFQTIERLKAIREFIWRHEILLEPISVELEAAASAVLETVDCVERSIEGIHETRNDWPEICEAWGILALALVTDARFECKKALFERRLEALAPLSSQDSDIEHRVYQERCLWAAYTLEFDQLDNLLDDWSVKNCDPVWMLRKAALLTEVRRFDESEKLIWTALNTLRKSYPKGMTIASSSRESWARASTITFSNRQEVLREWDELASKKCDASAEVEHIRSALQGIEEQREAPPFDFSLRETSRIEVSNKGYARMIAAYRAIRLPEVTGLPITNNPGSDGYPPMSLISDVLKLAAERVASDNPDLALRLVLRSCNYDKDNTLQRLLSRTRLATLPDETVATLTQLCMDVIEYALPRFSVAGESIGRISWVERLRVALEVLSRLTPRLSPELLNTVLDIALQCCKTSEVAAHHWLASPVRSLLRRSWRSMPSDRRTDRVFDLLESPIVGFEGFPGSAEFPDPGALVSSQDLPLKPALEVDPHFRRVVTFLIRGLHGSGLARGRAIVRLIPLITSKSLKESESSEIAMALWGESDPILDVQIDKSNLQDWVYLMLPELEGGKADRSFREKWLTSRFRDQSEEWEYALDVFGQVGAAVVEMEEEGKRFVLSMKEEQHIVAQIKPLTEMFESSPVSLNSSLRYPDEYISSLTVRVRIPQKAAEELIERIEFLLEPQIDPKNPWSKPLADTKVRLGFALVPGLAKALPDCVGTISSWLTTGLESEESSRARGAISALRSWLQATARSEMRPVPEDLIREVGTILALGHRAALADALIFARLVFEIGLPFQQDTIGPFALRGLSYLSQVLRYEPDQVLHTDVHLLRLLCTRLAVCMAKHGFENDATVAKWLDIGKDDPFPEIRDEVDHSSLEH